MRFVSVTLRAGDGLFLPARWWHRVEGLTPVSAAVNWYFEPPTSAPASGLASATGGAQSGGELAKGIRPKGTASETSDEGERAAKRRRGVR